MKKIFQNTVATGELATATGMPALKRQHSAYTVDSSSSDADPDADAFSFTPFSANSVSPLTQQVQSDLALHFGNTLGIEKPYRKREKRSQLSATQHSIKTIAGSIESLATSFRETTQQLAASSFSQVSVSSTTGLQFTSRPPGERGPSPSIPIEHGVLVLNRMLENTTITIMEYRQALDIVKADPVEVSIFAFGIPIMQADWIERNVRLI